MSYKTLYREPTWSEGPIFIKILYITFANWLKLLNIFGVHDCQKTSFDMADSLRTSTFLVTWIFYYWSFGLKQDNAISLFLKTIKLDKSWKYVIYVTTALWNALYYPQFILYVALFFNNFGALSRGKTQMGWLCWGMRVVLMQCKSELD